MSPPVYVQQWQAKLRPKLTLSIRETPKGFTWALTPRCGESKYGCRATFEEAEAEALAVAETMPVRDSRVVNERAQSEGE